VHMMVTQAPLHPSHFAALHGVTVGGFFTSVSKLPKFLLHN
jgi:hypothetical protein